MAHVRFPLTLLCTAALAGACGGSSSNPAPTAAASPGESAAAPPRDFTGGFPAAETARALFDDADSTRAVQMYRMFYPTVSAAALWKGPLKVGVTPNRRFGYMDTQPKHVGYTLNSDTPYGAILLDLHDGPLVVDMPAGPLLGAVMDMNQRWVADMGLPGPDAGKGGKHIFLPPDHTGARPAGDYVWASPTYRIIAGVRSLPAQGDVAGAMKRLETIKVYPLQTRADWVAPVWFDMTPEPQDTTPNAWETNLQFWKELHEVVEAEPSFAGYREHYGELAALGIAKGQPFAPDSRMTAILERAAKTGSAQMRTEAFADRRSDRVVWSDRKWEWAGLRFENGSFDAEHYTDTYARDKWFYQAIATSPAMFRRDPQAGSLYWLGLRDASGAYLDGAKSYTLTVPLPVPGRLFWSVTAYDAETRSQIATDQGKAALRSLFELKDLSGETVDVYFGPTAPPGQEQRWIKTIPGKGWFVYFRIYGPEKPAFDGTWKPDDFVVAR